MSDIPSAGRRLCPDGDRAWNRLRLLWLLAWTVPVTAAHFAIATLVAYRRLAVYGLKGQEDAEQARPIALELVSMIEACVTSGDECAAWVCCGDQFEQSNSAETMFEWITLSMTAGNAAAEAFANSLAFGPRRGSLARSSRRPSSSGLD